MRGVESRRSRPAASRGWSLLCVLGLLSACDAAPAELDGAVDAALEDGARPCASDGECDDGLACNGEERCELARCAPGEPVLCDDDVACTTDACVEPSGECVHTPVDGDGDGSLAIACGGDDCDDADAARFPGSFEVCDAEGHDEDCDPTTLGTQDLDGDGETSARCCNPDGSGASICGTDCDDIRRDVHPGAMEVCDGIDGDCDGTIDEGVTVTGYRDQDRDLHGDPLVEITACAGAVGLAPSGDDCDDLNPNRHGAMVELCDGLDNDCDGYVDETSSEAPWYPDLDRDGFGDPLVEPVVSCAPVPGHSLLGTDCDDSRADVSPRAAEACNGIDDDCSGRADFVIAEGDFEDDDGDGLVDAACGGAGGDCDDTDPLRSAGDAEICDGRDNDCDESVDEDVSVVVWLRDLDGDGFGNERSGGRISCEPVAGHVARAGDCDDANAGRYPGQSERCDGVDEDCDGRIDEASASSCALSNAAAVCADGACAIRACAPGHASCDGIASNGCERALGTASDCGACGDACGAGESCVAGRCRTTCTGDAECGAGSCCGGVCVDPESDIRNCGGCGTSCAPGGLCVAGSCRAACVPSSETCDGEDDDCDGLVDESVCTCGDGLRDGGEACDDGNTSGGDGCSADCSSDETCGNGRHDAARGEQCDDGNTASGDGCSAACRLEGPRCGDRRVDPGEACDDGNRVDGDGCASSCLSNETCGNGVRDVARGETCDDGNTASGDGCSATCRTEAAVCGDGRREGSEACDDGNTAPGDGCSADCRSDESCGNGIEDGGEVCDDGGVVSGDGCAADCLSDETCGNGIEDLDELCDDGNATSGDGCAGDCLSDERCGNAIVDVAAGERCDDGGTVGGDGCSADCSARCGDGLTHPPEGCDDGNTAPGDGCSATCTLESCGDGVVQGAEQCDDGNSIDGDACTNACTTPRCGDTIVQATEQCDDGNSIDDDACTNACTTPRCGDTIVQATEQCDDGNSIDGDACTNACTTPRCGDTILQGTEECDDGNLVDDDLCTNACTSPICGDGVVQLPEECDDGNSIDGDECTNACTIPICGDLIVQPPEVCDGEPGCSFDCMQLCGDGVLQPPEVCDGEPGCAPDCLYLAVCGNGVTDPPLEVCDGQPGCAPDCRSLCGNAIQEPGELCDDGPGGPCAETCDALCGNLIVEPPEVCDGAPGCSMDCAQICGDGVTQIPEECDDGNVVDDDECTNACTIPFCGDGITQLPEQCDDGNTVNDDECTNLCTAPICGDAIVQAGEECDDGDSVDDDECTNACTTPVCGDGIRQGVEECDDGNAIDGDACTNACTLPPSCGDGTTEPPEVCDGQPGCSPDCMRLCGDGALQTGEGCDDGNLVAGDGCSATCLVECGTVAWAQSETDTIGQDDAIDVAVDAAGNVYALIALPGATSNTYGTTTFTNSDAAPDTVVWSLTASGAHRWAARAGGTGIAQPSQIAVDAAGNVYVTGDLYGDPVTFGSTPLMSVGQYDAFVWSLSSTGAHRWAVRGGGPNYDYGMAIAVDSASNVYVGGQFVTSASFGGVDVSGTGASEPYVWSMSSSGATRWAVTGGGIGADGVRGMAVADDGAGSERVIATGFMTGTATFGSTVLGGAGSADALVWALAPADGATHWAVRGGGTTTERGDEVAVDTAGHVYVLVDADGAGTYGSTSPPFVDAVIWSLDFDGTSRWATGAGPGTITATGIAVSGTNVYATGYFTSATATFGAHSVSGNGTTQIVVASVSTGDGAWTCARAFGGTGSDVGRGVAAGADRLFVMASSTSNPLSLGATPIDATGGDAVIFRMDP